MDNNTNKEKWINEVLSSTEGIMRAQPGAGMYEKVAQRLVANTSPAVAGGGHVIRWAAAAVLLVAVNLGSVIYFNSHKQATSVNTGNTLASAMQSETTYNY